MPMLSHQLKKMKEIGMEEDIIDEKFIIRSSTVKAAKIGNISFKNDKFRKVRMTYFDAGEGVQVFNTLWYPDYQYDTPLLGVDLISLGLNRVLTVIDFQPLYPTEEYSSKYISHLTKIRSKYPDLQGVLSGKIYDDTSFFSKQMLFGRFADESKINSVVLPAFEEYLNEYVSMVNAAVPNYDAEAMKIVQQRQKAYDTYSAEKDPAVGLFDAYFGKEWSKAFVHDYLFSLSTSMNNHQPVHNFKLQQPFSSSSEVKNEKPINKSGEKFVATSGTEYKSSFPQQIAY
jgi:15,16-dihydrobiliverdin:ferredoxin oxidoreductase